MSNALMNPSSSSMEVKGAPAQTGVHRHKLDKCSFLLNKHEGREDAKLDCDIFEDFQKALHLLGKVMEIGNDTET